MSQPQGEGETDQQKMEEVRQALITVDQMKKKKGNRSMQDESKYKAAVQVVAKNKDLLQQMGVPQGGGSVAKPQQ